ncbi:Neural-cadherin [Portunus trituberculatus]|uniref:Neural-cadherin n=1 Tax=Portunus trituberculatus TaxID=210409 RepID=A0A5B7EC96_PORTR|nr:Neural-cadherin [Portunus trituberculatus]
MHEFTSISAPDIPCPTACLDDLRVSGHPLPLSPAVNGTTWGQVTTLEQLTQGCRPSGDPCANTSCSPPLSCHPSWDQPSCSCGPGRQLMGGVCEDVDECLWQPCLHGGSCHNLRPGFLCVCGPDHLGDHCQWAKLAPEGHPLTAPAAIAAIAVSVLVLAVVGVVLSLRLHRVRLARGPQGTERGSVQSMKETTVGGGQTAETVVPDEGDHDTLLELLRLKFVSALPELRVELAGGGPTVPLVPAFLEATDLLSTLPEAKRTTPTRPSMARGETTTTTTATIPSPQRLSAVGKKEKMKEPCVPSASSPAGFENSLYKRANCFRIRIDPDPRPNSSPGPPPRNRRQQQADPHRPPPVVISDHLDSAERCASLRSLLTLLQVVMVEGHCCNRKYISPSPPHKTCWGGREEVGRKVTEEEFSGIAQSSSSLMSNARSPGREGGLSRYPNNLETSREEQAAAGPRGRHQRGGSVSYRTYQLSFHVDLLQHLRLASNPNLTTQDTLF